MNEKRIKLGIPLDLLLDNECKLLEHERKGGVPGGLILPTDNQVGTGNIVIRGRPGTGKSILALQMAVKCCQLNPGYFSCFVSLEETPEHIGYKTENFGWSSWLKEIRSLSCLSEFATPREYGEMLKRVLTQPDDCPIHKSSSGDPSKCKGEQGHNHQICPSPVLLSCLSPRDLSVDRPESVHVYAERYKQLENLLAGAKWWRERKTDEIDKKFQNDPELRVVCIDSLNVFGNHLLTREQIYRLFDLFKRHQVIGVFVLEEDEAQVMSSDNTLHSETIEYLADVVVSLKVGEDEGYSMKYFEVVKSRFQHQIYGKHPFKIVKWKEEKKELTKLDKERDKYNKNPDDYRVNSKSFANKPVEEGIVIYPSLHYIVYGTEPPPPP